MPNFPKLLGSLLVDNFKLLLRRDTAYLPSGDAHGIEFPAIFG